MVIAGLHVPSLRCGSLDAPFAANAILPDAVAKKLEALVVALGNMLTVTVRALRLRTRNGRFEAALHRRAACPAASHRSASQPMLNNACCLTPARHLPVRCVNSYLQSGSSLQSLWNTLFWVSIALAAVLALHVGIRAFIIWRGWPLPLFFEVGGTAAW